MKTRLIVSALIGIFLACGIAWLSGFNFDQRGPVAVGVAIGSAIIFFVAVICPAWDQP